MSEGKFKPNRDVEGRLRVPPINPNTHLEWKMGEEVYLNFGTSGKLGPGKIDAIFVTECCNYYSIALPAHDDVMSLGFFGADWFCQMKEEDDTEV